MVKKIYMHILFFFTLFLLAVIISNIWLYKKESQTAMSITSSYQYNFIINETLYNKIDLIKHISNKYYKELIKNDIKRRITLSKNDIDKLIALLKTLECLGFKNYKSFLFKYIFHVYNEDIRIVQNNKIIISKNLKEIGKPFDNVCKPFKNYGECEKIKNDTLHIVKYSPAYKLLIESDLNLSKVNQEKITKNLLIMLKTIPHIIIYHKGKLIHGNFDSRDFYVFDEFKPLNIFFGFGIKYSEITYLSNTINQEVLHSIRPILYSFVLIYLFMIFIIYIALFTFFRKKILFIESILNEYSHKAVTDTLTGLLNREGFEKEIKNKRCHTLLILDMDNFKYINDTFGHEIGDIVLKEFAWLLKENFKNDIIARWGGDEFLLCTDKTKNEIKKIIEKINDRLFQIQLQFDNKLIKRLSISVGGCADEKLDIQKRFNNADLALYKVKKSNKGKVLFFKEIDYIKIEKEDINK